MYFQGSVEYAAMRISISCVSMMILSLLGTVSTVEAAAWRIPAHSFFSYEAPTFNYMWELQQMQMIDGEEVWVHKGAGVYVLEEYFGTEGYGKWTTTAAQASWQGISASDNVRVIRLRREVPGGDWYIDDEFSPTWVP